MSKLETPTFTFDFADNTKLLIEKRPTRTVQYGLQDK